MIALIIISIILTIASIILTITFGIINYNKFDNLDNKIQKSKTENKENLDNYTYNQEKLFHEKANEITENINGKINNLNFKINLLDNKILDTSFKLSEKFDSKINDLDNNIKTELNNNLNDINNTVDKGLSSIINLNEHFEELNCDVIRPIIANQDNLSIMVDYNNKYCANLEEILNTLLNITTELNQELVDQQSKINEHLEISEVSKGFNSREDTFEVIKRKLTELQAKKAQAQEEINAVNERTNPSYESDFEDEEESEDEYDAVDEDSEDDNAEDGELFDDIDFDDLDESDFDYNEDEDEEETDDNDTEENDDVSENKEDEINLSDEEYQKILDTDQYDAYRLIKEGHNLFITGKAGTGKTFLIDIFKTEIKKNILLVAPTGVAAVAIGGSTIHSAFGPKNFEIIDNSKKISLPSKKKDVLKNADLIIIDEISMVRADHFDVIDKVLKYANDNNLLFGGKQMVVFGDLFQLPPVVRGNDREYYLKNYKNEFFFSSNAYKNGNFKFIELCVNHRQANDYTFFNILNNIREGKILDSDLSILNKRCTLDENNRYDNLIKKYGIRLFSTHIQAEDVNKRKLAELAGEEKVYYASCLYQSPHRSMKDHNFPISTELRLKVGAVVMLTKNDPMNRWQNGSLATIAALNDDCITVLINEKHYSIKKEVFEEKEAVFEDGQFKYVTTLKMIQFPLILSYAISIHKSQGATYDYVACDVSNCFADGQAYVALSRCRDLNSLWLISPITPESIKVNYYVKDFYLKAKKEALRQFDK